MNGLALPDNMLPMVSSNKNTKHRLAKYANWLTEAGLSLSEIPLEQYRDELIKRDLKESTIAAHINTVKAGYRRMLNDREALFNSIPIDVAKMGYADQKAYVDEAVKRVEIALNDVKVKIDKEQDTPDSQHIRLSAGEVNNLLDSIKPDTLKGLRDKALISLMVCTGIREDEASKLDIKDLRQTKDGQLCLHIRHGKGKKKRMVPYGELSWCLVIIDKWLNAAGLTDQAGPVFVSYYKEWLTIRGRLTPRSIQNILNDYPIIIRGEVRTVQPHSLRRTYAYNHYKTKNDLAMLSANLGHSSIKTTLLYVGSDDMAARAPVAMYQPDLSFYMENK